MQDLYEAIIQARKDGIPAALATVTAVEGSSPGKEHFKMLVKEDGSIIGTVGGGAVESEVIEKAKEIIKKERAEGFDFNLSEKGPNATGMLCSGKVTVFIEPIISHFAYVFGGGHVGLALVKILNLLEYNVIVIDDREEFSNKERFPDAQETLAGEYMQITEKLELKKPAYIIITTRGHKFDQEVLEWAIKQDAKYIGMIGSKSKVATTFSRLKEKGITEEQLSQVHSPIGLKIGAITAEEIAVAIAAEMIEIKRARD
jgi:xanthine dehydrogenase accessory factor